MPRNHASKEIYDFIVQNVDDNPASITRMVSDKFNISRQSVNRHLQKMIDEGILLSEGTKRGIKYHVKPIVEKSFSINIVEGLEEDRIWRESVLPNLKTVKRNVLDICHYGFTEIFNNVLDHAEAQKALVKLTYTPNLIRIIVADDGIGIFKKIARDLKLEDERQAILELAKGKLTTDPKRHTGEGIFFTTRMFDNINILSFGLFFSHFGNNDWLIENEESKPGTTVFMSINPNSNRTTKEVFDKYTSNHGQYGFTRTIVPVTLLKYGEENLVSRSQAKRLLARFDSFKEIVLDFKGVELIGQAFADEIFRVFKNEHPDIHITHFEANEEVEKIIQMVIKPQSENQLPLI